MTTESPTMSPEQADRIRKAKARLEAARLRVRACGQDQYAAAYTRQIDHPAYEGQGEICAGKAVEASAYAAETRAKADLLEAEAGI